jgi:plastocyanin
MPKKVSFALLWLLGTLYPLAAGDDVVTGQIEVSAERSAGKTTDASNVVVWLIPLNHSGKSKLSLSAGSSQPRLRIVQKHKTFDPHVLVVQVGWAVEFPNLDPLFHNVFSLFEGKRFDLGLYEASVSKTVRFDWPGVCYIFCNIHPEMSAVVVVVNSPYFAISERSGRVAISDVPNGLYRLHVWHERSMPQELKDLSREITISDKRRSLGRIPVPEVNRIRLTHKNKYGREYDPPTKPAYSRP